MKERKGVVHFKKRGRGVFLQREEESGTFGRGEGTTRTSRSLFVEKGEPGGRKGVLREEGVGCV